MNQGKDILADIYKRVPKNIKICFSSGLIFGILTHLYMLTNKLPNWDDITNMGGFGSGAEYGRWLLQYIHPLFGRWSIPALNGVLTVIFLAMAACFLVAALRLKTVTSAVLVPLLLITFPGVACMMTYMFTVHLYAAGIMMCCMGTYFYRKYRKGFWPAMLLFILSCSIYQSFICLAVGILIFALLMDLLQGDSFQDTLKSGIKAAVTLAASLGLYLVTSKIFAPFLTEDRGISTMGQVDVLQLPRLVMRAYKRILEYFVSKPYSFISPFMHVLNIVICVLIVIMVFWIAKEKKVLKEIPKVILLLFLGAMIPLALAAIYIMAPETQDATMLMLFQYFLLYVMAAALLERCLELQQKEKIKKTAGQVIGIAALAALLLMGYHQYRVTNEAYFRMGMAFDRAYGYYNRMIMELENTNGYQYGDAFAILGDFYPDPTPVSHYWISDEKFEEMSGIAMENGLMTSGVRSNFMRIYLGIEIPELAQEETEAIKETKAYQEMPDYPAEGSLQKINDVWVIKVHEDK